MPNDMGKTTSSNRRDPRLGQDTPAARRKRRLAKTRGGLNKAFGKSATAGMSTSQKITYYEGEAARNRVMAKKAKERTVADRHRSIATGYMSKIDGLKSKLRVVKMRKERK